MLAEYKVTEFLNELHSNSPAPGGGSVAALNGAVAASLVGMVANLTVGKKNYAEVEAEMMQIRDKMAEIKDKFVALIDEDANSFNGVIAAFKMPKETDEEKAARTAAIQSGYKDAIAVPFEVAKSAAELFDVIEVVVKKGNKNAESDGLVAALSVRTAIISALLNVEINLSSVKDADYVEKMQAEVTGLKKLADEGERRIMALKSF